MSYLLDQPMREIFPNFVFFDNEFTKEECERIIAMKESLTMGPGLVGDRSHESGGLQEGIRRSNVAWIEWSPETDWIYAKLAMVANKSIINFYGFHLAGFKEHLQLTHYTAEQRGHYRWHQDLGGKNMSIRKLSLVLLLNDAASFEGGQLELFNHGGAIEELKQGTVVAFPSYEPHRVTEVTKGERWSLVSWVSGPPFI